MQLKNLLVVIDPTSKDKQPSLERASLVAIRTGANVELLICDHNSALEDGFFTDRAAQQRARAALLAERLDWLEELAKPLQDKGIKTTCKVRWGKPLYDEIIAHVKESNPDLVFRNATTHGTLQRLLFNNTSWQLIRRCPAPLWLVREGEWRGEAVATAVDPVHAADKPAALDHRLIEASLELEKSGMQAHYVHSYNPLPKTLVLEAELVLAYDDYLANAEQRHKDAFAELFTQYPVKPDQQHLLKGVPEEAIPRFVAENNVDLLVMGAISRGSLENALIGNTAERVLENSDCDLLVIKPA